MPTRKTGRAMHVALLRGINVGKAKRIAMADLRELCIGLGYSDVRTLLNSGNVVFAAPRADAKAAARIEKEIESQLGVLSRVLVITGAELDEIVSENPITEAIANPSRFLVTVFAKTVDRSKLKALAKQDWGAERLGVGTHAAYLWCPTGILESPVSKAVGKLLGDAGTSRNWATITKLHALTRESSDA